MTIMLAAAVLMLAGLLVVTVLASSSMAHEVNELRDRLVTLEREAGDKAGEAKGLTVAIEQAGLGQQLSTAKARVEELQADVDRMRFDQRAALERAQTAPSMVALPSPYYPRNGG